MSYNNYTDTDAARRAAYDHAEPCVAIIKHANPCGIAIGADVAEAHRKAHACDPVSAYGGVIAVNRPVSKEMAEQVAEIFTEVIVAPDYEAGALEALTKKKNIRVLKAANGPANPVEVKAIDGGVLLQEADRLQAEGDDPATWTLATGEALSEAELAELAFAWKACRAVKSNAILLAKDGALEALTKKKNIRVLRAPEAPAAPVEVKPIDGGALLQVTDRLQAEGDDPATWTLATGEALSEAELAELAFAWKACRAVKSNAILLAKDGASVGVGMGQVNRVDSAKLAVERAGAERAQGAYAASDAFFPFPDGLEILTGAGVKAVVQPGGSVRDELVVEAAKKAGVTMYFTGTRHFFH
jgi:AICAR transformylase/IMP cyclohydrolase PurH